MTKVNETNKTDKVENKVPEPPTGTRMSAKGKNLVLLIFAALAVFILWAIFSLAPKAQAPGGPQDATTISANQLQNPQQKGQDLVNSLRNQAYGTAANNQNANTAGIVSNTVPQPMNANAGEVNTSQQQFNSGLTSVSTAGGTTVYSTGNTEGGSNAVVQSNGTDTAQQIIQSGMQSSLTPSGFNTPDTANTASNNNNNAAVPTEDNGTNALANAITQASSSMGSGDQNMQAEKTTFLQNQSGGNDSLSQGVQTPASNYMIMAGSIIPATLITGIDSDLPGQIQAIVSQNVYDSQTGNNVLIPQGSRLIGVYDSQIAYGQSRVLMVWTRIIFPNDQYLDLQGMPGADLSGFAGLTDQVDNHYLRIYGSALLMSIFSAGMQLSQPNTTDADGAPTNQQIFAAALGQNVGQLATQMAQKNLNIQPTINIRPGDQFNVLVTRDIPFTAPYSDNASPQVSSTQNP